MHVDHDGDSDRPAVGSREMSSLQSNENAGSFSGRRRGGVAWLAMLLGGWLVVAMPLVAGLSLATSSSVAVAQDEFLEDDLAADEEPEAQGQNLLRRPDGPERD